MNRELQRERLGSDEDFLRLFGERVRGERARRGMSRKLLASHANISERYVTQLESGRGNVSILILRQLAAALGLPLTRLVEMEPGPEMAMLRGFLMKLSAEELESAYELLSTHFSTGSEGVRERRIALIGLRGAGKTTIGKALAGSLAVPFFELDREIERLSGTSLGSIIELYGQHAYRRYEQEALQNLLERNETFVVATGGSIVSESATFEMLLRNFLTVWVKTSPEEHMARVIAQGDKRPMAGSNQAMNDLRRILAERTPLYARADITVDTTRLSPEGAVRSLLQQQAGLSAEDQEL